ncbi:MAG TPA: pilus assembly protein TadG-related protein [Phenylobacterium sp.]|nr:pilus assembly protein TadG-related protein [Phenylobacterium sp.]
MTKPRFSLRNLVRDFISGPRAAAGNVALMFAIGAPILVGAAGIGVETTYWSYKSLQMQGAADAAAHAAALEQRAGGDPSRVNDVGVTTATENGFDATDGTIVINSPPTSGPAAGKAAVEVIIKSPAHRFMSALFSSQDKILTARAVARFNAATSACILALNPAASKAALFSGSTNLGLTGCSVMANSLAADAVVSQGSATVAADCLISAGGVSLNTGVTMTQCDAPVTQAPPVGDPFKTVPAPANTGPCLSDNGGTLQPGRYCAGMTLKNTVKLNPGVYVVSGGDFRVNANANITGAGVTIYLVNGSHLNLNGNATIQLSAPTSGTYSGILFMGDRNSTGGSNVVNGTAGSLLTGAIYFAKESVDYLGNFSGQGGCTQVVADTIQWSGNTSIKGDCTALGMKMIPALAVVRLTE